MQRVSTMALALLAAVGAFVAGTSLSAHHGTAASYDQDTFITVTGVVTEFRWKNPHSSLHLQVTDEKGTVSEPRADGAVGHRMDAADLQTRRQGHLRRASVEIRRPVGECLFNCDVTVNGAKLPGGGGGREGGARRPAAENQR